MLLIYMKGNRMYYKLFACLCFVVVIFAKLRNPPGSQDRDKSTGNSLPSALTDEDVFVQVLTPKETSSDGENYKTDVQLNLLYYFLQVSQ